MEQLLVHAFGDYIVQTSWMAGEKTSKWWPAIAHGLTYTAAFLLLTQSWLALVVIGGTHTVIDRFRLAKVVMWLKGYAVGKNRMSIADFYKLNELPGVPNYQYFWLIIIIDNTIHLGINYLSISYL